MVLMLAANWDLEDLKSNVDDILFAMITMMTAIIIILHCSHYLFLTGQEPTIQFGNQRHLQISISASR